MPSSASGLKSRSATPAWLRMPTHVAKLSITGVGIRSHAGVADRLFKPLADEGINIDLVSTSEVRLNVVVAAEHGERSLAVLRQAFGV